MAARLATANSLIAAFVVKGYYDGVTFHRIISDFVAQTGDPYGMLCIIQQACMSC
jgi:cyclophilin family peptidyl-prolyl cis-trans isomerase